MWKSNQHIVQWDKTQLLKKFSSDNIKSTNTALSFLSRAPTHQSFKFSLWFLYELKYKFRLSKTVCGIFHFRFCFVYIFVQQNAWTLSLLNVMIPVKENHTDSCQKKPHTVLQTDLWFLSYNKKFENPMISAWVRVPQKLTWVRTF